LNGENIKLIKAIPAETGNEHIEYSNLALVVLRVLTLKGTLASDISGTNFDYMK